MKKPKRKKPKFRVGQVVKLSRHNQLPTYISVTDVWTHPDYEPLYSLSRYHALHESKLRPLTTKEIGPRRKE